MHLAFDPAAHSGLFSLSEEESRHCIKVLRMNSGDAFRITNGKGLIFDATIIDAHPKHLQAELAEGVKGYDHWPFKLSIGIAPTKNSNRLEWFLEKATEMGVDEIYLFESFHSERRKIKLERLQKVMIAAMKQSVKSRLPKLYDVKKLSALFHLPFDGDRFIAWIDDGVRLTLVKAATPSQNTFVLIGPEGDFSRAEIEESKVAGFVPVSLGASRLRTETAGVAAVHTIQLINQM
ncbi:MAG: 16S rRNA (uracil(1498)-N(3))-methyltransferase [Bacteroidales bacterium]|jgi:16S rRNA (uracil1498-N3)-methyltransferase|nr:16S rRNA (uracil(1498)-N(3))-methyltransferase [Bacteroidales bacterium]